MPLSILIDNIVFLTLHTRIFDCICYPCISFYIPPW